MDRIEEEPKQYDLCGEIIGAAMKVHSTLGAGFLESVYQNALIWELRKNGFKAEAERPISVHYDGQMVGAFTADVLVNDSLIVELKAIQLLAKAHEVQLVNYLAATGIDERLEFKKKFRVRKQETVSL
jgi:GxxExxY protein